MKWLVFYKTNDVFTAEEILLNKGISCEIVPTPVQDKAYCGVCLAVKADVQPSTYLFGLEYISIGGE